MNGTIRAAAAGSCWLDIRQIAHLQLRRGRPVGHGVADARPRLRRSGRLEPASAGDGRAVRDSLEDAHAAAVSPRTFPVVVSTTMSGMTTPFSLAVAPRARP